MKTRCTNECAEDFKRVEAEKQRLLLKAIEPKDSFRWLIEAPGQRYLAVQRLSMSDDFVWTPDHNNALAFRSKLQADALMMAVRQMDRAMHGFDRGLFAFEATLGNACAIEHAWVASVTSQNQHNEAT